MSDDWKNVNFVRCAEKYLKNGGMSNSEIAKLKNEIQETAKIIAESGVCVEINTGGMSRGYLDSPYPSEEFLGLLYERNVPITLSSDAHAPDHLDFGFDGAIDLAKKIGYREIQYFDEGKMIARKI